MSQMILSVIIPILGPEKYIPNLKMLLSEFETEDVEILFIHDCPSGNNSKPLTDLCEIFPTLTIRVISGRFGSAGIARNAGLTESNGEWICFCDADDHVILKNILMDLKDSQSAAMIVGQFERVNQKNQIEAALSARKISEVTSDPGFWRVVYKRSAIGDTKFQNFRMGEDVVFLAEVLRKKPTIVFSARTYYRYSVGNPSQSTSTRANFGDLTNAIAFLKMSNRDWHQDPTDFGFVARLTVSNIRHFSKSSLAKNVLQFQKLLVINPVETVKFCGRLAKAKTIHRVSNFL